MAIKKYSENLTARNSPIVDNFFSPLKMSRSTTFSTYFQRGLLIR